MKKIQYIVMAAALMLVVSSCEKVSPLGVLVSGTGVEDRVKMSNLYYMEHKGDLKILTAFKDDEYTFLVGSDSHLTTDDSRMREMLQIALDNDYSRLDQFDLAALLRIADKLSGFHPVQG